LTPGPEFILLTGFLGSGKTTLLRDYLTRPEAAETAIIVNEAGEIGLDGAILRESAAGPPIAMLANGCVCCQAGSDLALAVDALLAAPRPDDAPELRRIILETSGLSRPGPLLRQLATLAEHRLRVTILATFDATRGTRLRAFEEAAAQWAAANRIVLTKADAVGPERLAHAAAEIASLNPLAEICVSADRAEAVTAAFAPLTPHPQPPAPPRRALAASHPRITVTLARPSVEDLDYADLAAWLDNLAGALGERLLRLKGLIRVRQSEAPLLVQSVGTMFAPPRPFRALDMPGESFLVIIARDAIARDVAAVPPHVFRCTEADDR
jgi:G3E family GTPase